MVVSIAAQPRSARFSRMSEVEWLCFRNIYFICERALVRVVVTLTRESAIGFNGSVRTAHRRTDCFAAFGQVGSARWRPDSASHHIFTAKPNEGGEEGEGDVAPSRCCPTADFFRVWPFYPLHPLYRLCPGRFGITSAAAAESPSAFFADGPIKGGKGGKGEAANSRPCGTPAGLVSNGNAGMPNPHRR